MPPGNGDTAFAGANWKDIIALFLRCRIAWANKAVDLAAQRFQHDEHAGGIVFKRNDLDLKRLRAVIRLCPKVDEVLAWTQYGSSDANHKLLYPGDMAGAQ